MSEMTARRFAWGVGFVLLSACTALVLKALPSLGPWSGIGIVASVALAWVVLGWTLPRVVRPDPPRGS
jgi:hypothetical protein